jgi:hypothetical protein
MVRANSYVMQQIEKLLGEMFSVQPMPRLLKESIVHCELVGHVEAGPNTLIITL